MERKHATEYSTADGRRSPRSDNNMNDSCVKIYYIEGREREISFILADFVFHPRPRKL